jgi:ATP-dependent 26S proteasome regulatory subunit
LTASAEAAITIIVATNRPFDVDTAIFAASATRFFLDLPSARTRLTILEILLRGEQLADDVDLSSIATATSSHSGSDLKKISAPQRH